MVDVVKAFNMKADGGHTIIIKQRVDKITEVAFGLVAG